MKPMNYLKCIAFTFMLGTVLVWADCMDLVTPPTVSGSLPSAKAEYEGAFDLESAGDDNNPDSEKCEVTGGSCDWTDDPLSTSTVITGYEIDYISDPTCTENGSVMKIIRQYTSTAMESNAYWTFEYGSKQCETCPTLEVGWSDPERVQGTIQPAGSSGYIKCGCVIMA